jgi:dUTP pyrophosphatase
MNLINNNYLQVKLNFENAVIPQRSSEEAAGFDLYSYEDGEILPNETKLFDTGISFKVPKGTYGRIAPRSGLSKKGLMVNAGVIDRDYTGPVKVMLHNLGNKSYVINKDDRIAQLIIEKIETPKVILLDKLEETERGEGGFGSTGK